MGGVWPSGFMGVTARPHEVAGDELDATSRTEMTLAMLTCAPLMVIEVAPLACVTPVTTPSMKFVAAIAAPVESVAVTCKVKGPPSGSWLPLESLPFQVKV